ncbi:HET-domain-containing protein [Trametes versicolor FP-101664 SS1]|uniref:HET-domain-containing protein n=1 Tax=Trametes versicolor (strain FP-101664) TaxID=717944 RepID=UPI000462280D|nr:HET-domain-containing protein [Trametes versicolor FP-101664 SS1]EIW58290.1 HET-domain-containing protein [Trametes versicolor FP-101664 SS1]
MPHFLNTWTGEFEWHADPRKITYAILSHTWRSPDEGGEQSYSDVRRLQMSVNAEPEQRQRRLYAATVDIIRCHQITTLSQAKRVSPHFLLPKGAAALPSFVLYHPELSHKIKYACKVARRDGYLLLWIDTCCIDKSSSAELSEAINSMFEWYRLADVCYAYLEDVPDDDDPTQANSYFSRSRWHKRGWTLQELIAPKRVVFLTRTWGCLGTKAGLASSLEKITGVDFNILTGHISIHSQSVARRMSWAACRETTRIEDQAYSLLGIFGIHMSPIYGEGQNAFLRLQEEIVRTIPDHSIFAWGSSCALPNLTESEGKVTYRWTSIGLLAETPLAFKGLADITPLSSVAFATRLGLRAEDVPTLDCLFASQGVRVKLPCIDLAQTPQLFKALLARKPESPSPQPTEDQGDPDSREDVIPSSSSEEDPKPADEASAEFACSHSVEALRRENESLRTALSLQTDRVSTLESQMAAVMSRLEALDAAQGAYGLRVFRGHTLYSWS